MAQILFPVGQIAAGILVSFLDRPKRAGPITNNQITSSAPGAPIPFGYGEARIAGQLIWTDGVIYTTHKLSKKGDTGFLYYASLAMAFCEGPASIIQIYGDSKLIFDSNPNPASDLPASFYPAWNSDTLYNPGNLVSYGSIGAGRSGGGPAGYVCLRTCTNIIPGTNQTFWNIASGYGPWNNQTVYYPGDVVTYEGQIWVCMVSNGPGTTLEVQTPYYVSNPDPENPPPWETIQEYYGTPTIYAGAGPGAQLPDPLIQAAEGVAVTPAYTRLCYLTWANLPLENFGGRIPNMRAVVQFLCSC